MLNLPVIYEVNTANLFAKPYYFITKREITEFEFWLKKHINDWICYEWTGYINKKHKVIKDGGFFRYWANGTVTNR